MFAAEGDDLRLAGVLLVGLEGDEGAGRFTPLLVGARHHGRLQHRRVAVEHAFQFDG
ncbi:hypothetical protein D9M69_736830 [compost metagenome]